MKSERERKKEAGKNLNAILIYTCGSKKNCHKYTRALNVFSYSWTFFFSLRGLVPFKKRVVQIKKS